MTDKQQVWFMVGYLVMAFLVWCYFIAAGLDAGDDGTIAAAVLFGWVMGLLWPAVVTVTVMLWLFF